MKKLATSLARALTGAAAALERLWRGMLIGLARLAQRLRELWLDAAVFARDLAFRLALTGWTLAKVLALLSPGIAATAVGFVIGSLPLALVGLTFVVGLVTLAVRHGDTPSASAGGVDDLHWMSFFNPSWRDHSTLRRFLDPVLRAWLTLERALDEVTVRGDRHDPVQALLRALRRASRARMHSLRRHAHILKKRRSDASAIRHIERTHTILGDGANMVRELATFLRTDDAHLDHLASGAHDTDALDDVRARLAHLLAAFRELRR